MEYLTEFATAAAMVAFLCALLRVASRRLNFRRCAYEVGGVGFGCTAGVAAAGAAAGAGFFFAAASASLASTSAASIG